MTLKYYKSQQEGNDSSGDRLKSQNIWHYTTNHDKKHSNLISPFDLLKIFLRLYYQDMIPFYLKRFFCWIIWMIKFVVQKITKFKQQF